MLSDSEQVDNALRGSSVYLAFGDVFCLQSIWYKAHQYLWKRRDESMRPEFAKDSKCWKKDEGGAEVGKLYNWMNIRHHFH